LTVLEGCSFRKASPVKFPRRKFLTLAASVALLPAVTPAGRAETYPSRPVHWIVSFLAGGANDIVARIIGQYLSDYFGQQIHLLTFDFSEDLALVFVTLHGA
jgi:hypothetical protein